ncbi:MAG: hypothetical protein AB1547_06275, partial [Thermodesulfobacteriota bacterium]
GLLFNVNSFKRVRPIQRYPAASNTFSQQSQKASPATPLMPGIPEKHGKSDFLRAHHITFPVDWTGNGFYRDKLLSRIQDDPAKSQGVFVESRGDWGTFFAAAKKAYAPPCDDDETA